jgi:hypothetical protein
MEGCGNTGNDGTARSCPHGGDNTPKAAGMEEKKRPGIFSLFHAFRPRNSQQVAMVSGSGYETIARQLGIEVVISMESWW